MNLGETFNLNEMPEDTNSFEPLPAGEYQGLVTATEVKTTKNGTGQYIRVEFTISGPTGAGRKVWANYNIRNANPMAAEIGRRELGSLMKASGLNSIQDSDQLMTGATLGLKLTVRKSEEYGDSNEVKGVKALNGSQMPAPAQQLPAQHGTIPQSAPAGAAPPWAK